MTTDAEQRHPVLEGVIGWVRGEVFPLKSEANVIGRSRHCDISLRQCDGYLRQPPEERDLDHDFNTVSRRHVTISVKGTVISIEDLSTNGTFCNEVLLTERKTIDLAKESPLLRLGTRESFRISMWPSSETGAAASVPAQADRSSLDTNEPFDAPVRTEQVLVPKPGADAPNRTLKNRQD